MGHIAAGSRGPGIVRAKLADAAHLLLGLLWLLLQLMLLRRLLPSWEPLLARAGQRFLQDLLPLQGQLPVLMHLAQGRHSQGLQAISLR